MTDAHPPSSSKTREVIVRRVFMCFTAVRLAGFRGGDYKPINNRMLDRSDELKFIAENNRLFKTRFPFNPV